MTDDELVRIERTDDVATIRLARPPMNALSSGLSAQLLEAAITVSADDSVHAVVIYGGEKVFAAGADVKEFTGMAQSDMLTRGLLLERAVAAVAAIPKPVIAAVTGYALGGGCELALAADLRVSGDNVRWGQPEILLGIIPGAGGTQRLPRLVGPSVAKDLIYSGRFVDAAEAKAIGLADHVVPAAEVYDKALELARSYAKGPAIALAAAKAAVDRGLDVDLETGLLLERTLFAGLFGTEDMATGVQSFIDNGPGKATFVGR